MDASAPISPPTSIDETLALLARADYIADRSLEPWTISQVDGLTGELDPPLREPIAQDSTPTAQMWCPQLKPLGVVHQSAYRSASAAARRAVRCMLLLGARSAMTWST